MTVVTVTSHIFEAFISVLFFEDLFVRKRKLIYTFLFIFGSYVAAFLVFLLLDSTVINILLFFIINSLFAFLIYDCTIRSAVLSSLFLTATITVSEFLVMSILALGHEGDINIYNSNVTMYLLMVIFSKTLSLIITKSAIFAGLYLKEKKGSHFPFFLLLYPVTTIAILYTFWIISEKYELSTNINIAISVASVAIIISVFLTYIFQGRTSKKIDELFNAQKETERINADIAYYALLDRQNDMLKTITHDEKNHLAAIKAIANNQDVSDYIDKINREIKHHSMFGNTQNRFLDLLLNKYSSICDSNEIEFDYSVKTANLSFMDAPDIITLISNILDNAVDAAKQSEKKIIYLSINKVNGCDTLSCTNSCNNKPKSIGKNLITTKTSNGFHGFGMKSIKRIAGKYKGECDWAYNEQLKEFIVNIVFFN